MKLTHWINESDKKGEFNIVLSIQNALQLPIMKDTKLVAGEKGIHNQINWVTVVEIVEDIERVEDGEFLITTGFNLLEDDGTIQNFHDLIRYRALSGIAIYTSFYMESIPESFIMYANEHHLPLIEIPVDINFSEITKAVLEQLVNRQTRLLEQSENIHRELTNYVLNDQSLTEVTKRLAQLTYSNIFIYNEERDIIYSHIDASEITYYVPTNLLHYLHKDSSEHMTVDHIVYSIYPIIAKQACFGWIVMTKHEKNWQQLDDIAIERSISIYAMEFIKKQAVEEAQLRIQSNLLEDIFSHNYINEQTIIDQAWKLHYDITVKQCVFHITFTNLEEIEHHHVDRLYHLTEQTLQQKNKQHLIQSKLHSIIFLTDVSGDTDDKQYKRSIQLAKELQEKWKYFYPKKELIIGIGRPYEQLNYLNKSAVEAQYAVRLYELMDSQNGLVHYQDVGMYDLLLDMDNKGINLIKFYEKHISSLIDESNQKIDLIKTLDVYFKQNQSIQKASEKLFIHRHTLRYRLKQIEIKTGLDLKCTDDLLKLQLGMMAFKLVSTLQMDSS